MGFVFVCLFVCLFFFFSKPFFFFHLFLFLFIFVRFTPDPFSPGLTRTRVSVLIFRLRGVPSAARLLPVRTLSVLVGEYRDTVSEVVLEEGGTPIVTAHDTVVAFWNAPLPSAAPETAACRAAVRALVAIEARKTTWSQLPWGEEAGGEAEHRQQQQQQNAKTITKRERGSGLAVTTVGGVRTGGVGGGDGGGGNSTTAVVPPPRRVADPKAVLARSLAMLSHRAACDAGFAMVGMTGTEANRHWDVAGTPRSVADALAALAFELATGVLVTSSVLKRLGTDFCAVWIDNVVIDERADGNAVAGSTHRTGAAATAAGPTTPGSSGMVRAATTRTNAREAWAVDSPKLPARSASAAQALPVPAPLLPDGAVPIFELVTFRQAATHADLAAERLSIEALKSLMAGKDDEALVHLARLSAEAPARHPVHAAVAARIKAARHGDAQQRLEARARPLTVFVDI
jgi:class 3 adenylate cyclase